jgi:nucleotide-binding universal stress UspA family protein
MPHDGIAEDKKSRVAIAYNGTESSQRALAWALGNYLDPRKHTLIVLSALNNDPSYYVATLNLPPALIDDAYERAMRQAREAADGAVLECKQRSGFTDVQVVLLSEGEERDTLVDYVNNPSHAVNLLIMGSRDMRALKRY